MGGDKSLEVKIISAISAAGGDRDLPCRPLLSKLAGFQINSH